MKVNWFSGEYSRSWDGTDRGAESLALFKLDFMNEEGERVVLSISSCESRCSQKRC